MARRQRGGPAPTPPRNEQQHQVLPNGPPEPPRRPEATDHQPTAMLAHVADIRVQRALQLILLAALSTAVSQANLSPVFGAVPAALYHSYGALAAVALALALERSLPMWTTRAITPFCFWIPTVQLVLFRYSSLFGPVLGPQVIEALTCLPVVTVSVVGAIRNIKQTRIVVSSRYDGISPRAGLIALFAILQRAATSFVASLSGPGFLRSRIGLQFMVASLYGMVLPSNLIWLAVPPVTITMLANPHCNLPGTTEMLNNTLHFHGFTLLERRESNTGYLSVLEDNHRGFRVLRCDHSLLGGEWKMPPSSDRKRRVGEPIYAIFTMLEAVRLVERSSPTGTERALNIGLGIGTAPAALIAHGVNTTVIEIDPVVHEFATRYFGLPQNHVSLIGDAAILVNDASRSEPDSYDYIIHDVFTGGAEPAQLFTVEFLVGLRTLLKPDGTIAINYAGDVKLPASSLIYRTVTHVFPSCRVFREDEGRVTDPETDDFTNMVFFCRKLDLPIQFRPPVTADFLGSGARREFLLPTHEILPHVFDREGGLLRDGETQELARWQKRSAIGHWKVMRTVLPEAVWENW